MSKRQLEFHDETFRDGPQSLWAMRMRYSAYEACAEDLDNGGFSAIDFPAQCAYLKLATREFRENFWDTLRMIRRKIVKTPITIDIDNCVDLLSLGDPSSMVELWWDTVVNNIGARKCWTMVGIKDEVKNDLPFLVPLFRKHGLKWSAAIAYAVSPRHTDEHFVKVVQDLLPYKPDSIWLKDAGGLLTSERAKVLIPKMMAAAPGVPFELHSHGSSTHEPSLLVDAMDLGVSTLHTCVRPLAWGTSKTAIDVAVKNAETLGYSHRINLEPLKEVERKLTLAAKQDNLPICTPLEYDVGTYTHMVPGGVMSNLVYQCEKLGIGDRVQDVLEEVPRIHAEMGYPVMITPPSQFIVSQAAVNVAVGERYKVILDPIIDMALGVYGVEEAGLPQMDQNVRDRILGAPMAKSLEAKFKRWQETKDEITVAQVRQEMGLTHCSDEDFLYQFVMKGDADIKKCGAPKQYYFGTNNLGLLLHELSKDHDLTRIEMKR